MENVTFSEEQFGKLIEAIRPGGLIANLPSSPTDETLCRNLACDLLQIIGRTWNPNDKEYPKLVALIEQLRAIAKEYV